TATKAGSTRQPSGTGSVTCPLTPSRPARTRSTTGAGFPVTAIAASRAGVTVAGGTIAVSRIRSPKTGSVATYCTGTSSGTLRPDTSNVAVTRSGAGPRGSPINVASETFW